MGNSQALNGSQVVVDVAFARGLFRVEQSHATGKDHVEKHSRCFMLQ
jgi:hypothetical protein